MIRLATAFSGIGAIEHALNRMGLENEIVFACDNGDVNILTKDVDTDIDEIETELESLRNIALLNITQEEKKIGILLRMLLKVYGTSFSNM